MLIFVRDQRAHPIVITRKKEIIFIGDEANHGNYVRIIAWCCKRLVHCPCVCVCLLPSLTSLFKSIRIAFVVIAMAYGHFESGWWEIDGVRLPASESKTETKTFSSLCYNILFIIIKQQKKRKEFVHTLGTS
jgi:hypothetical protein